MKRTIYTVLTLILAVTFTNISYGQSYSDKVKKRQIKAGKMARKQAKKYSKEGWAEFQGSLPMAKQLEKAWNKQMAEDEEGNAEFLFANGNAVAGTLGAADMASLEKAKLNLVGQLESKITAIAKVSLATEQNTAVDATTVDKVVTGSKNRVAMRLRQVEPTYKVKRNVTGSNGQANVEVEVMLFYSYKSVRKIVEEVAKKTLKEETENIHEELDGE